MKPKLKKQSLDTEDPKSYRPIANSSFLSKLLERTAAGQLRTHLDQNCLLDPEQSAYRRFHSTESCLLKTINDLYVELDQGKYLLVIGLDLSAAFDTLDFANFGKILEERFKITGKCKQWIMSYLTERKQQTQIRKSFSSETEVFYGVPQGSILGPMIFSMYTTPIGDLIKQCNLRYQMYADDTVLYTTIEMEDEEPLIETLRLQVKELFGAFTALQLKVNPDKTEIMLLSTKKKRPNITTLKLDNFVLNISSNLVSLGVNLDQHLSFEKNVNKITSSCYNELRKLYRIKQYLSLESRKIAVQNLIISRLDYCNAILAGLNIKEITKLQRVQNAACLFIFNLRKESCREFRYNLHWLPVAQRIDFKILTYVHKIVFNLNVPLYLKSLVILQYKYNQTRSENKWKLKLPKIKNSYGSRAFSFLGPKKWNALPSHLRCIADHTLFRKELKTFLFSSSY